MESDRPPQKHTKTGTTRELRERAGGWIRFFGAMGDPDATQQRAIKRHGAFVDTLDSTEMVKSYKMLVLHAMLNATKFPGSIELADHVAQFATRTSRAAADIRSALNDRKALIRLLEQNPLAAWAGGQGTAGFWHLSYGQRDLSDNVHRRTDSAVALREMVRELAEWRLTEYLDRAQTQTSGFSTLKVSQASGRPILFLPRWPEGRIVREKGICGGRPVFKGTRVTLRTVLASLADGDSVEQTLTNFPSLKREDATPTAL